MVAVAVSTRDRFALRYPISKSLVYTDVVNLVLKSSVHYDQFFFLALLNESVSPNDAFSESKSTHNFFVFTSYQLLH